MVSKQTPELQRLAYYSLLAASMAYREMFFRDDIAAIKSSPEPTAEQALGSMLPHQRQGMRKMTSKTARKIHNNSIDVMEKKIIYFNKMAYAELDSCKHRMNPRSKENFESIEGYLVSCAEELLHARNQHEVLMLLRMYNAGQLDVLFEEYRKEKQYEKTTTEPIEENP